MKKGFAVLMITLCCVSVFGQSKPRIAVYVAGVSADAQNTLLSSLLTDAFVKSKQYRVIERDNEFMDKVTEELRVQYGGGVDDDHIVRLGRAAGATIICVARVTYVYGRYHVSARILDVETKDLLESATVETGQKEKKEDDNLTRILIKAVNRVFGDRSSSPAPKYNAYASDRSYFYNAMGLGLLISGDLGGGVEWNNSAEQITIPPYVAFGGYVFYDAIYAMSSFVGVGIGVTGDVSVGGGGGWDSENDSTKAIVTGALGAFVKSPIALYQTQSKSAFFFPIAGARYVWSNALVFKEAGKYDYLFTQGDSKLREAGKLDALWLHFGAGFDFIRASDKGLTRFELLYGRRTPNIFEKKWVDAIKKEHGFTQTMHGHGLAIKVIIIGGLF